MADEATHTETSTTEQAATETATTEAATETSTATEGTEATAASEAGDDLGGTALGGEEETTAAAETEGTETEGAKAEVPETYELTAPEGFEKLDPDAVALATPVFKELGLSNEQANMLMPVAGKFAEKIVADRDAALMSEITAQRATWLSEAKADPEIGGANWEGSLASAAKALDQLGFPKGSALRVALNESGFGNHPELIRAFVKAGKAIGEDTDFNRGESGTGKKTDKEIFYGTKD